MRTCARATQRRSLVYPESGIGTYDAVLMKASNSSWADGYGLYYSGGSLAFYVNHYSNHRAMATVPLGRWTHVVER